jgi:hypothetical protein
MAWWIAETDALKRLQQDVPEEIRHDFVRRSRTWILQAGTFWPGWPQAEYGTPGDDWSDQLWEQASLACLWKVVLQGVERVELQPARPSRQRRLRDRLEQLTGIDTDLAVHELLIRLCAALTDQGLAGWPLPHREQGLWKAFLALYSEPGWLTRNWLAQIRDNLARLYTGQVTAIDSLRDSLQELGVSSENLVDFLRDSLVPLRGWAGLLWQLETRGDRVAQPVQTGTLLEFLAVRLLLDCQALRTVAAERLNYHGPLSGLWRVPVPPPEKQSLTAARIVGIAGVPGGAMVRLDRGRNAAVDESAMGEPGSRTRNLPAPRTVPDSTPRV